MPPLARSFFPLRGICRCYATNSIDRNGIMLRSISPALVDVALWAVACRRQPTYLEPGKIDPKQPISLRGQKSALHQFSEDGDTSASKSLWRIRHLMLSSISTRVTIASPL
jgi:hypothetical protein